MVDIADSAGILVLGMHRSGTSALSRMLAQAGADVGERVLGASAGNEGGHWEDAFAVELHERLLAGLGARWDEPFPLPDGWMDSPAADTARDAVRGYLAGNRGRHRLWSVKDPRLSLFGGLWTAAADTLGLPLSCIILLRHPLEVADSLAARDGIGRGQALLLWLDHTLSALRIADGHPTVLVDYAAFLAEPVSVQQRIARLPGAGHLDAAVLQRAAQGMPSAALRHHHRQGTDGLPGPLAAAWRQLQACAAGSASPDGVLANLAPLADGLRAMLQPFATEQRVERRLLWERVARSEAAVAKLADVGLHLGELRERGDAHYHDIVDLIGTTLQRAQADAHGARERLAGVERELVARSEQLHLAEARATALAMDLAASREAAAQAERRRAEAEDAGARADAQLRAERDRLREASDLLRQILQSRSWALTRPLRVLGRLLRGEWSAADTRALRRLTRSRRAEVSDLREARDTVPVPEARATGLGLVPAAAEPGKPDVFVWAVIDWHFRTQRPQHLARALAEAGHRVFYVSNNFQDVAEPGFAVLPLDTDGRLFQVHLHLAGAPQIYADPPSPQELAALRGDLSRLLGWADTTAAISIVQHPYWTDLASMVPNARLVYDCMDHHPGFANNASGVLQAEERLVRMSDLVVVTSAALADEVAGRAREVALIRNATDHAHFATRPRQVFADPEGRAVIGYYGAIAEWFDLDLVRAVANACPGALVLLVGADTVGAREALADLPNVQLVGEVPYAELPYWLHAFDVCLLPFRIEPLTLATNPVKVYEYLAAGKPVVAVDLPEMRQFDGLVRIGRTSADVVAGVKAALAGDDAEQAAARSRFAAGQTWAHRATDLQAAIAALHEPVVSVVVLAYNNLALTRACLASLEAHSDYRALEVIVVDNASQDGSREWLQAWAAEPSQAGHARRLHLNDHNAGFAAGNNLGLALATGDVLVLLNNDTEVTPGWVRTLLAHFRRDARLGLLGPVTDNIGNEARVELEPASGDDLVGRAAAYTRAHPGGEFALRTAAFFCVAMPRAVYAAVGGLDEGFGLGFFEDDDYCRRVEAAGYRIACAEDVFVHHHLSASFNKLGGEARDALFARNRSRYEGKWGPWTPHAYRDAKAGP